MKNKVIKSGAMKILLTVALCFCTASLAFADHKSGVFYLEESMKPLFIAVNDTYCFIGERFSIFQYSLKDFKLIKKFGGKGQGPGEFPVILDIHTTPRHLIISSLSRVYIYSKDGEFISEKKTRAWSTRFDMAGGQFLGMDSIEENKTGYDTINLLNGNLDKEKELYRYKKALQSSGSINPLAPDPYFGFIGEKILISTKDDRILLFNNKGVKEGEIKLNLEKQPVHSKFKKSYHDSFKKNPRRRMLYKMIKNRIVMPEFFPGIQFTRVDSNLIYIVTFQQKDKKYLCLVLKSNGKELKRAWIPLPPVGSFSHPFTFYKGSYYRLKDDLEREKWMIIKKQIFTVPIPGKIKGQTKIVFFN